MMEVNKTEAPARIDLTLGFSKRIYKGEEVYLYKNMDDTYTFYDKDGGSFRVLPQWFEFKKEINMWIKLNDRITEAREIENLGVWTRIKGAGVKRLLSKKELIEKHGEYHPTFEEVVEYNYNQCFIPGAIIEQGEIVKREEKTISVEDRYLTADKASPYTATENPYSVTFNEYKNTI